MEKIILPNDCPIIGRVVKAYGDEEYASKNGIGDLRELINLADSDSCTDIYYINDKNEGILWEKKGKDIKHAFDQLSFVAPKFKNINFPLTKMFTNAVIPPEAKPLFGFKYIKKYDGQVLIDKTRNMGKGRIVDIGGIPIYKYDATCNKI